MSFMRAALGDETQVFFTSCRLQLLTKNLNLKVSALFKLAQLSIV